MIIDAKCNSNKITVDQKIRKSNYAKAWKIFRFLDFRSRVNWISSFFFDKLDSFHPPFFYWNKYEVYILENMFSLYLYILILIFSSNIWLKSLLVPKVILSEIPLIRHFLATPKIYFYISFAKRPTYSLSAIFPRCCISWLFIFS